jgi:hypothetical protein
MNAERASNGAVRGARGTWAYRSGGYFGFGSTPDEALRRSQDSNSMHHFLRAEEIDALRALLDSESAG